MAYVVTKPCIGTKDRSCVEVCPVDCFYNYPEKSLNEKYGVRPPGDNGEAGGTGGEDDDDSKKDWGMLVINPDECINCGACETECPVEAIFEDSGVPEEYQEFVKINENATMTLKDDELDRRRVTSKK
jgi:NAD-dependent dihydropyrimidine dehydrogenase PreA subunit